MKLKLILLNLWLPLFACQTIGGNTAINTNKVKTEQTTTRRMTPEILWKMKRVGKTTISKDGKFIIHDATSYDLAKNKGHKQLFALNPSTKQSISLTKGEYNDFSPQFIEHHTIAFLSNESGSYQIWMLNLETNERTQLSNEEGGVNDFLFSPDGKQVILIKEVETTSSIEQTPKDLPLTTGMVINDLMYRHWDQFIKSIPHPFLAQVENGKIIVKKDLLEGKAYECPMLPFGGIEQLSWSPDGKYLSYTTREKTGLDLAISTDSDIFLYEIATGKTSNLCKTPDYKAPINKATFSLANQAINQLKEDQNVGYDINPQFSPDGNYIAWLSMKRDGYESDYNRLCIYDLKTHKKFYVTQNFKSTVDQFLWKNNKELYFTSVWYGKTNIYKVNLKGEVKQLTNDVCDYVLESLGQTENQLLVKRHSMSMADEIFVINTHKKDITSQQISSINTSIYQQLDFGKVEERWVKTSDNKDMLCWVIYPPHFDPNKKYSTLLFCEGGPQTPVSQFWSYRWNFQIMAANDYIIIAPNRRGLPGFGLEWLEEISGDYPGQCMKDYLSAIDDICTEPYVDKQRLGAVGASFGGYSVYWLAGNHDKRFKCFIAHDGIFNTEQQYLETEELWFANWDLEAAPWEKTQGKQAKAYRYSPHKFVDKWDTPILCIHGMKDYRILNSQGEAAFQAAKLKGVPAQLLLFPDENHWVVKPQNGVLWQRTFFNWLNKWLK